MKCFGCLQFSQICVSQRSLIANHKKRMNEIPIVNPVILERIQKIKRIAKTLKWRFKKCEVFLFNVLEFCIILHVHLHAGAIV